MAELTRKEIIMALNGSNRPRLAGLDLSNENCARLDFENANMRGANIRATILREAILRSANMTGVNGVADSGGTIQEMATRGVSVINAVKLSLAIRSRRELAESTSSSTTRACGIERISQ